VKILLISDLTSIHTLRWAETLLRRGHDVHVASFRDGKVVRDFSTYILPTFNLGKFMYPYAFIPLRRLFKSLKPDVVHAHHVTSYAFVAALANIHPLVVTAWGSDVLIAPWKSRIMKYIVRYSLRRADSITIVADHMKDAVGKLGIPLGSVRSIPFGVDVDVFQMRRLIISINQPIRIICTRNFAPMYDIKTLIKALAILKEKKVEFNARLSGGGPQEKELRKLVSHYCLEHSVSFLGHIDQVEVANQLNHADIFVSPSLSDGNNISLNEAMACGCFPIVTNIPANTQWITHEYNGLLFQPGDYGALANCIEKASHKPHMRETSRLINRKIVEDRANWSNCVTTMENIYENLIGGK
jgi:glycosyltransferase involved in cell wall biosynthesis